MKSKKIRAEVFNLGPYFIIDKQIDMWYNADRLRKEINI